MSSPLTTRHRFATIAVPVDSQPDDTNGQCVEKIWFAATPQGSAVTSET